MRIAILGILAGVGLAMASLPAVAETPLYRGATVSMENGVRVIRPVSTSRRNFVPVARTYVHSVSEVAADRFAMFDSVPRNLREIGGDKP